MVLLPHLDIISLALGILLLFFVIRNEIRLKKLLRGNDGKSLEKHIALLLKTCEEIKKENNEIKDHIEILHNRLRKTIRGVETIRFNPFKDQGSNQSFATAFINDEGNGVVLSSLYARDRMSVFAKPIQNAKSEYELTDEEKIVLEKATKK